MRAVVRSTVRIPDALSGESCPASKELRSFQAYLAAPVGKRPKFTVYKSDSVKKRLDELFHGKCSYCESFYASTAPVDVEHYRPKGAVHEDESHPGYWWLAMNWENLLPSCIDCNRKRKQVIPKLSAALLTLLENRRGFNYGLVALTGKKDSFPILGTRASTEDSELINEHPLLLDPCRDTPEDHLEFFIDRENLISLVLPKKHENAGFPAFNTQWADNATQQVIEDALEAGVSLKGVMSIHVYGLNRLGLVQERTRLLRQLEFLETVALEVGSMAEQLEPSPGAPGENYERDKVIVRRLYWLQDEVLKEIKRMAEPSAPYSVMVQTWIEGFKARLMGR
ncbi:endonuclease [Pseudomonas sp. NY15435]|uniref:endonuclease n=1 Tax=Pseudomonas sp. NY15435 TaxID=3400358 RepID=UPI003A877C9E